MTEPYDVAIESDLMRGEMAMICAGCGSVLRLAAPGHEDDEPTNSICARCRQERNVHATN